MLPKELIDIILEYAGYHKWRNGKYVQQINLYDYPALHKLPKIQKVCLNRFQVEYTHIHLHEEQHDYEHKYIRKYTLMPIIMDEMVIWRMTVHKLAHRTDCVEWKECSNKMCIIHK